MRADIGTPGNRPWGTQRVPCFAWLQITKIHFGDLKTFSRLSFISIKLSYLVKVLNRCNSTQVSSPVIDSLRHVTPVFFIRNLDQTVEWVATDPCAR